MLLTLVSACGILSSDEDNTLLKVKTISAVEVALEVQGNPGDQIIIARGGEERYAFRLNQPDTLIYETGLEPATSYTWSITNQSTINGRWQNHKQQATTLDTTSSNFTWQTFSFGEHSSSVLYGVSIIDENNIWAVGEIYMNDSTGQADSDAYNVAHWNGTEWDFKKLQFYTFCNQPNTGSYPATSVIAFSENDLRISSASQVTRYNGTEQIVTECIPTSVNKLWGTDSSNVYAVGNNSTISHYNGQSWQKIETGTELDFYDIHGNEQQGVVAIAARQSVSSDKAIVRIKEDLTTKPLSTTPIPFSISGIWFDASGVTYVVGSRISVKSDIDYTGPWRVLDKSVIDHPYLFAMDANGLNDLVAVDGYGEIIHFNGGVWTLYEQGIEGNLYDIAMKENAVMAVGYDGRKAFITIGKRVTN